MAVTEHTFITAIVTRLQTISVANGYNTAIGANVADSQTHWDEEDDLPAISVFQGKVTSEPEDAEGRLVWRTMPVLIKGFLKRQNDSGADALEARESLADIFRAIRVDESWGVIGTTTMEKEHGPDYGEQGYELTGVQVEIDIKYLGQRFDLEA